MREILIVAGEASGDLHASGVAHELKRLRPDLQLTGIGGPRLAGEGVKLLARYEDLAVMGFTEIVRHIPRHYLLLQALRRRVEGGDVALVILVDYPGFNMKVAAAATRARVPVLYYITPQVWAWGAGRLQELARTVTRAAVILPFEENLLRGHGIKADFVGHPLLDGVGTMPSKAEARRAIGLNADDRVLALFPGSRAQEITRHLDDFVATARILEQRIPQLRVVVSAAPSVKIPAGCPYPVITSASFTVLRAADAALCKSGTTTLEAAICGCPLVVTYRTGAISYLLAKRLVRIPHIALVNVVAGREVAKEFVQNDMQPENVADALQPLLDTGSSQRNRMLADLAEVGRKLGERGASARVAEIAGTLVGKV